MPIRNTPKLHRASQQKTMTSSSQVNSRRSSSTWLGPVHGVPQVELILVLGLDLIQLFPQQDVVLGLVGIEEGQLCLVFGVFEHRPYDLEHRGDAGATCKTAKKASISICPSPPQTGATFEVANDLTCNHVDPPVLDSLEGGFLVLPDGKLPPAVVDEVAAGTPDLDAVADGHVFQVLGHLAPFRELGVDPFEIDLVPKQKTGSMLVR